MLDRPLLGMAHLTGNSIGGYHDIEYLLNKYEEMKIYDITHESFEWYAALSPSRMVQVDETCRVIRERRDREAARRAAEEAAAVNNSLNGKGQKK